MATIGKRRRKDVNATCLEYLDLRLPKFNWKIKHANLKNYWDIHKNRQSYLETKPEAQTIETMEN